MEPTAQNLFLGEGHRNKLNKSTLIIIPVFNEGSVIQKVAKRTLEHSSSFANILFINEPSPALGTIIKSVFDIYICFLMQFVCLVLFKFFSCFDVVDPV